MPFEVSWLVEGRVMHGVNDSQNISELVDGVNTAIAYVEASDAHIVHAVFDVSKINFSSVVLQGRATHHVTIGLRTHPRFGTISAYGVDNLAIRQVLQTMTRFMGIRVFFSNTKEEAYAKLQQVDDTLPDLLQD